MAVTEITKRDGRVVPFDPAKIEAAVFGCLTNGCGWGRDNATPVAQEVSNRVTNVADNRGGVPTVEEVQDLVEIELAARSMVDELVAYRNYREQHRLKRVFRPVTAEEEEYINRTKGHFRYPFQIFNFLTKYARWQDDFGRRETWEETVDRTITFLQGKVASRYQDDPSKMNPFPANHPLWNRLRQAILKQDAMPAMRMLQMAGPAASRCNVGIFNCTFGPIDDLRSFAETLYILMQGSGAGYSVESVHVEKLPRIKRQSGATHTFVVPDHTKGWCDALLFGLERWFDGEDVIFDYSGIRPAGTRLKTKGGRASGPEPLKQLLDFTRETIFKRQGKVLTTGDAFRICCMIGKIVQVGGVRRASEICLSDLEDDEIRYIKSGDFYAKGEGYLSEANISAAYEDKPDAVTFMREWVSLAQSGTGERGIFNRGSLPHQMPARRLERALETWGRIPEWGTNPCGEIILPPRGFCNLTIAVAREGDTLETLAEKVEIATILGTLQSLCTDFAYLRPEWRQNAEAERLLGVDLMGDCDCELLRPNTTEFREQFPDEARTHDLYRAKVLEALRNHAVRVNAEYAAWLGIPASASITCRKPAGNSKWTLFASSLEHWEAPYIARRFRNGATDPVSQLLIAEGVPHRAENGHDPKNPQTWVFTFPVKVPEGAIVKGDLAALDQLENWLLWKRHWCEHNPSCTIKVKADEWLAVGNWVYEHWDEVGGLSFLPEDNGVYEQVPNQPITSDEYDKLVGEFPDINWAKLVQYEEDDEFVVPQREAACTAGGCLLE